jgi:hypothetical protein
MLATAAGRSKDPSTLAVTGPDLAVPGGGI